MSSSSGNAAAKRGLFSRLFSRKASAAKPTEAAVVDGEGAPPQKPSRSRLGRALLVALPVLALAGGAGAYVVVMQPFPGLFGGAKAEASADVRIHDGPQPASALTIASATPTQDLKPSDYQIVMVFGEEAFLSSPKALLRVKVGSNLPGLGEVISIVPSDSGGIVEASNATLRTVAH